MLIFNSCQIYKPTLSVEDLEGVYTQESDRAIKLKLEKKDFTLYNSIPSKHSTFFKCCDTISKGVWQIENDNFISLTSSIEPLNFLSMKVDESFRNDSEGLTFLISNPIENHYTRHNEKYRELSYEIYLDGENNSVIQDIDDNYLKVTELKDLKRINIIVSVKCDIPLKHLAFDYIFILPYEIKNTNANIFKITIPELSYEFLGKKRLNRDYLKLSKNRKSLIWDGLKYTK